MMELRDLRAFVLLADVLHFRLAAERLHVTQSALSKQIQRLEAEYGLPLFVRGPVATRLTPFGRVLFEDARAVVESANRLAQRAALAAQGLEGTLRIGFGTSTRVLAPRAIAAFRATRPHVQIQLLEMSARHQVDAMNEGRLDLGFCRLPQPGGWPATPLIREALVAIFPADYHPDTPLAQLADVPLAMHDRARSPGFHDHAMSFLARQGISVTTVDTVPGFSSVLALVEAGVAWAIVPASTLVGEHEFHIRTFDAEDAYWQIGLIRAPGEASPLMLAFWDVVTAMPIEGRIAPTA
jgi:DNA-binding transcriptional LysR family regulator